MSNIVSANPKTALLEKVREVIPEAAIDQIDDILNTIGSTPEAVMAKPGKLQSFLKLVEAAQPGSLEPVETPAPITPVKTQSSAHIESAEAVESGDRDWATFNPADLETLSIEDLTLYSGWQEQEEKRMALLNKIRSRQATTIAARESSLQAQLNIAETSRRVLQTEAQVKFANQEGAELDALAVEIGTATIQGQFQREKAALEKLGKVGNETPTLGEVALLQATVVKHDRLNMAANIQNSIAPLVKAIGASTEKSAEAQTIDV